MNDMRKLDKTKLTVLTIGCLAVVASLFGAIKNLNLMNYVFPLYMGLTLVGTVLLHKEEAYKTIDS